MTARRAAPLLIAAAALAIVVAVLATRAVDERSAVGVVVAVDAAGLTEVRGFTLRTMEGEQLRLRIGELENGDTFPPGHLTEHAATSEPVRVLYREQGGERIAYRLEDAPAP